MRTNEVSVEELDDPPSAGRLKGDATECPIASRFGPAW